MINNPKVGDRVILTGTQNADTKDNPHWGGRHGYTTGRVSKVDNNDNTVKINWNTGRKSNWYSFNPISPATRVELLMEKMSNFLNKKWLGTLKKFAMIALLVVVVDFLFLKGRGLKALRVKLNSAIDETLEKVS